MGTDLTSIPSLTGRRQQAGPAFKAALGYGVPLPTWGGLLTPLSEYEQTPHARQVRLGLRWLWRAGLTLELDGRSRDEDAVPDAGLFIRLGTGIPVQTGIQ